jgi:nucleotide-binding universal stress UspA family protein
MTAEEGSMRNADWTRTAAARTPHHREAAHSERAVGPITHAAASALSGYAAEESSTHAILAAIKPGDASHAALAMAHWLAEHERRELHVVSVIESAAPIASAVAGAPYVPPFHDDEERRAVAQALRAAYDRHGRTAARCRIDVCTGAAAPVIAEIAREHEARMIVVGKGTHGLLRHLLHGEHVMQIIRRSRSPVLVVPSDATAPIDRAMVAFDFSMASIRAAVTAHEMLGAGGRLVLVHVATPRGDAGKRSRWWLGSLERRTRETLREFARALPPRRGVTVETEKIHGDPVDVLTAYAATHSMQLLACGWHEHAVLERVFGESDTRELLHRAPCAVLVAPEPRGRDLDRAS